VRVGVLRSENSTAQVLRGNDSNQARSVRLSSYRRSLYCARGVSPVVCSVTRVRGRRNLRCARGGGTVACVIGRRGRIVTDRQRLHILAFHHDPTYLAALTPEAAASPEA